MIYAVKSESPSHANTKVVIGDYEISIAMDDSCGAFKDLLRTNIAVFKGDKDVTGEFSWGASNAEGLLKLLKEIEYRNGV